MNAKSTILTGFNDHFADFLTDIQTVFPEDADVRLAKNSLTMIRKVNPKTIIRYWYESIVSQYKTQIDEGNLEFFITKDYTTEVAVSEHSEKIMNGINRMRDQIQLMNEENQKKSMKYIQNLTKLSILYFTE